MYDIYNTLKTLPLFIDNEYLEKYACLIEHNRLTKKSGKVHSHHIVPRSWYKLTSSVSINDYLNNRVNLHISNHILAHYYLCLCTADPFKFSNELALFCLLSKTRKNSVERQLITRLSMYNIIYDDYIQKLKQGYRLYQNDNKSNN